MRLIAILNAAAIALSAMTSAAYAADVVKGDIKITQPWMRATPGGAKVAAGYLTITNTGKTADRLVGGTALVSGQLEIHDMTMTDGVMRMRHLENGVEIAPGATVTLKPGGMHVMFVDLKGPVKQGDRVMGTLVFQKAGSVEIEYDAAAIGAAGPSGGLSGGHEHKQH
jgi:periplasmic copper chaperone A